MNLHTALTAAACALVALGGCSSSKNAPAPVKNPAPEAVIGGPAAAMPRAVVYRTSGDYNQNVPVTIGPDGSLQSYPAPSDVSPGRSAPLVVADGFLLDRRGISSASVFTRYTYAEYSALAAAPAPDSLLRAVIPGARVTEMYTLPMTPAQAAADTAAVNAIIRTDPGKMTPVGKSPLILRTK